MSSYLIDSDSDDYYVATIEQNRNHMALTGEYSTGESDDGRCHSSSSLIPPEEEHVVAQSYRTMRRRGNQFSKQLFVRYSTRRKISRSKFPRRLLILNSVSDSYGLSMVLDS